MNTTTDTQAPAQILEVAEMHVRELLTQHLPPEISFQTFPHTKAVAEAADDLAEAAKLSKQERQILILAAFFHATGLTVSRENYLAESSRLAGEFLRSRPKEKALADEVQRLIETLEHDEPTNRLAQLLHDAHHVHFGSKDFLDRAPLLRQERESLKGKKDTDEKWNQRLNSYLEKHKWYTTEASELYGKRLEKNLKKAKKQARKAEKSNSISSNSGARTMFKTALRNHIDLTSIADAKANIMLSVNALIVTIGLPAFSTYFAGKPYLLLPAIMFLITSFVSMVFATLSTRPIKMSGETNLQKLKTGKTNLFFFGNFYRIPRDKYEEAIRQVASDTDYLDTSYVNDLYYLGLALGDKFRYLRVCYNIFMIGVSLSAIGFGVAYLLHSL